MHPARLHRARRPGLLAVTFALTAFAGGLSAQDRPLTPDERAQTLQNAIEAFDRWQPIRERAAAHTAAEAAAEERRESVVNIPFDTMKVGPFLLMGDPEHLREAGEAVARVWPDFDAITGGTNPFWVEDYPLGYSRYGQYGRPPGLDTHFTRWVEIRSGQDRGPIVGALRQVLAGPMAGDGYIEWSGQRALSPIEYPRQVVRNLLESPSPLAADCFQDRNIDACALVLDLDYAEPGPDREAWVLAVYPTAALRYEIVSGRRLLAQGALAQQRRIECSDAAVASRAQAGSGQDLACTWMIANTWPTQSQPLGAETRASLFRTALRLGGGTPALERIERLPEDASPRLVIEAAAQRPAEEVVSYWLDNLSAADGDSSHFPSRSGVFWAGALALFALRSTRWRLG